MLFLKNPIKRCYSRQKWAKVSNFQKVQNHDFWNFDFWFLSRGNCKLLFIWMQPHHIEKNERISLSHPILCVASKFVCKHYDKAIHWLMEKMVNYCAEIWKLLPRDRKNVVLYTVNNLGLNQITKFTSKF